MTKLAIINTPGSGATDAEVQSWMLAVADQLANEFFDAWTIAGVDMRFIAAGDKPTPDEWWVTCLASSDVADALGYHDLTPTGLPLAKVFVQTTKDDGAQPSVCFDHEVMEMLVDPYIQLAAMSTDGKLYSYEVADAVEDDACGYKAANGVLLSDFVTPAWFSDMALWPAGTKFSFNKKVSAPFNLAPGGYISVYENGEWSQLNADVRAVRQRPRVGSRRERRRIGHNDWMLSTKTF